MNDIQDKKLYAEFIEGNNESFEKLVKKYKQNVIYFISKYTKNLNDAEDIFEDVVVFIIENKNKYDREHSFKAYFYMLAKSRALNFLKSRKNYIPIENIDEFRLQQDELLEDIITRNEKRKNVINAINQLKVEYSNIIYLTQIEDFSYKEAAVIMNKTPKQIKNMLYYAKKKLKEELKKDGFAYSPSYNILKNFIIILLILLNLCGVVYATVVIYNKYFNAKPIPVFTGEIKNTDINGIWCSNFQLAWKELSNQIANGSIEFESGQPELVNKLNNELHILNNNLSEDSYYLITGKTSELNKTKIEEDIKQKFNLSEVFWLNNIDFNNNNSYTIYYMLYKTFEFSTPFYRIANSNFGKSDNNIKYFGNIDTNSLKNSVTILFYESKNEFAIKLNSTNKDNIILYRSDICQDKSFKEIYNQINEKSKIYKGPKELQYGDKLRIPYVNVDTIINYDDLCGKHIKNTNGMFIANAIQNVKFKLNNKGVNIYSESNINNSNFIDVTDFKELYFDNTFIIFAKENCKSPYFALKIDTIDLLEMD